MLRNIKDFQLKNELMVNESFFNKTDDKLKNLIQSIKNLIINAKYHLDESYKLTFFKKDLLESIDEYYNFLILHYTSDTREDFNISFYKLYKKIDSDLLDILGFGKFVENIEKILEDKSIEDVQNGIHKSFEKLSSTISIKKLITYLKHKIETTNYSLFKELENIETIDNKIYEKYKYYLQIELLKLHEWVVENKKKVLVIFDGRDAAGKGGSIESITKNLDPKNYRVVTFDIPTKKESKDWFKRYIKEVPKKGEIVIFDRSWYNRGYLEPAMDYCSQKQYEEFMEEVNGFEKELIEEKNINLIKIWLSVSKNVQLLRFELRKSDPLKYWKFSLNDENTINKWEEMSVYINKLLKKTNEHCDWNVINSNDKNYAELMSMITLLKNFDYSHKNKKLLLKNIKESVNQNVETYMFLDIDGVLIPYLGVDIDHSEFDKITDWSKEAIQCINDIVEKTGCKIIISSSYRKSKTLKEIQEHMEKIGFKFKIDDLLLPYYEHDSPNRGKEILNYLSNHKEIKDYVIVDDKWHDFKEQNLSDKFVKIDNKTGIKKTDIPKILNILTND